MKKILILLFILTFIFSLNLISAGHTFEQNSSMPYGKVLVKDWCIPFTNICFGGTVATVELKENNGLNCGQHCDAIKEIHLIHDGLNLVDSVEFETINPDGNRVKQPIRSYQFYYQTKNEKIKVDEYELQCHGNGIISPINGTEGKDCNNVKTGWHWEDAPEWTAYTPGTPMPKGKYIVKLEGEKKSDRIVDWIITSNGEKIDEWAMWGASPLFQDLKAWYRLNETAGSIVNDDFRGLYNGKLYGGDVGVPGLIGKAMGINGGTNDFVGINNSLYNYTADAMTLSFWVYPTDVVSNEFYWVLNKDSNNMCIFRQEDGSNLRFACFRTTNQFAIVFPTHTLNTWHHYVIEINKSIDGNITLWKDGTILLSSNSYNLDWLNETIIENNFGDGDYSCPTCSLSANGSVDEIGWWDRYLTPSEIQTLYNSGSGITLFQEGLVTLNSPANNYISPTNNVQFNCSANLIGSGATLINISLWTNSTGSWVLNQSQDKTGTSNNSIFTNNYQDNSATLWSCQACDSDGDCGFAGENRTVLIDTSAPSINIHSPAGNIGAVTVPYNILLNYTSSDVNPDSCWYNSTFNSTITYVTCNQTQTISINNNSITQTIFVYANDSVGNQAVNSSTFNMDLTYFPIYNLNTIETSSETINLNITYDNIAYLNVQAKLIYNGTSYDSTVTPISSDNVILSNTINIPTVIILSNLSFYWNITLSDGNISNFITEQYNQTVAPVLMTSCGGVTNTTILNFTTKEEATFNLLNTSIEMALYYGPSSTTQTKIYNFSDYNENVSNYRVCLNPTYGNVYVTGIVSYYAAGYDRRDYWFNNAHITNITQDINLYLLATASSDIFTFTVKDETDSVVQDAYIYVERWDIGGNNFYTVGILKTDTNGNAIMNLRLNDAWYRYKVIYNNILYLTEGPVKEATTSRILRIAINPSTPIQGGNNAYKTTNDISHSLTFNNASNTFTFSYTDITGYTQVGCIKISKMMMNTTTQIYKSCINSPSGTLSYIATENGTFGAYGIITLNENFSYYESIVDSLVTSIGIPARFAVIGTYGRAISMVAIGTVALIGVASGSIVLGLGLVILTALGLDWIGLINVTSPFLVIYILISITIMIIIGAARRRGGG